MEARLRQALARAEEVAQELADPDTARNPAKLKQLGREHARLDQIRQTHERLDRLERELAQAREVLQDRDPELSQLARADVERLRPEIERLERRLADLLTPADPLDDRDAIVEIRAGTGGDEAALFAAGLFRSEEHTSELQSQSNLVCRLLLEKKKNASTLTHQLYQPMTPVLSSVRLAEL